MERNVLMFFNMIAKDKMILLVMLAVVTDTVFGILRALKEKKFNSSAGINGAIRKIGMLISLIFALMIDLLVKLNLIGFIPEEARLVIGLEFVGICDFFSLLYICYEAVSILKNMTLCGLPVKKIWVSVSEILRKYTEELPPEEVMDNDHTE